MKWDKLMLRLIISVSIMLASCELAQADLGRGGFVIARDDGACRLCDENNAVCVESCSGEDTKKCLDACGQKIKACVWNNCW